MNSRNPANTSLEKNGETGTMRSVESKSITFLRYSIAILLLYSVHCYNISKREEGRAGRPIHLLAGVHLFVDDHLIEKTTNLTRTTHQPEKLPDPIFTREGWHEKPLFYQKVMRDPDTGKFRMWYIVMTERNPSRCYCYAESNDGIHWTRPNLKLLPFGGTEKNNICVAPNTWGLFLVDEGPDYPDQSRRYKMACYDDGLSIHFSADGLRFEPYGGNPVVPSSEGPAEFCEPHYVNLVGDIIDGCRDPIKGEYMVMAKQLKDGYAGKPAHLVDGWRRTVGMTTSRDFIEWKRPWSIVLPDPDNGIEEFYGAQPMVRGNLYIGFLRVLRDDLSADEGGPVKGIGWTELITSRNGVNWIRHQDKFLDRNPESGTFDHAMAWIGDCVTVGNKDYIYYGGYSTGHKEGDRRLGVAILRRNGFVSRDATAGEGLLRTPLLILDGNGLSVNARVEGQMQVRVLDRNCEPIRGFDWADCTPIRGDSIACPVEWKGRFGEITGKPVRLEFILDKAQLYAFRILE